MTETVEIVSPIDGRVYAERALATATEIKAAVALARHAQAHWRRAALAERAAGLTRFIDALLDMNEEIVPELAWQMGRPVRFGGEARGVEERGRHMIAIAEEALKPIQRSGKDGFRRFISREPLGTMLVIAPWNYPYLTAINAVVPGLMAGNAVILKHASQTLLVGERFAAAVRSAGLPEGIFQNFAMSHDATERLIGSGEIDHINFTGSAEGGRRIEMAAAGTFASLTLELGGKDPAYVREDAPLEASIENLVDGAFYNSGQSCCGVERIYVHENLFGRFVEGFVEHAKTYTLGNPLDMGTMVGPMAQPRLADLVREQMAEALRKGAKAHLHTRDDRNGPGSPYLPPEILTNVNHQMAVMREESFGPVVGIMKVRDDDEAIALMNDSPYGLTASIWTSDFERAAALGARIETGTVFMNRCDYLDPGLVWTGVKETGKGGSLSEIGYHNLTQPKSYHLRRI
ncbi:MAG TPA: aldehyde dehydrogenase family protein [Acetobacteraceae bacterium]|nr:aldehyde dehydrogenase family protein [Acetobacteraceae bacterium]